eukprot:scaffold190938_cov39-Prasinocladus_malaysianus.AAC.1
MRHGAVVTGRDSALSAKMCTAGVVCRSFPPSYLALGRYCLALSRISRTTTTTTKPMAANSSSLAVCSGRHSLCCNASRVTAASDSGLRGSPGLIQLMQPSRRFGV